MHVNWLQNFTKHFHVKYTNRIKPKIELRVNIFLLKYFFLDRILILVGCVLIYKLVAAWEMSSSEHKCVFLCVFARGGSLETKGLSLLHYLLQRKKAKHEPIKALGLIYQPETISMTFLSLLISHNRLTFKQAQRRHAAS